MVVVIAPQLMLTWYLKNMKGSVTMDYYAVATVSIDTPPEVAYNASTYAFTSDAGYYERIVATIPGTFAFAVPGTRPNQFNIYVIMFLVSS